MPRLSELVVLRLDEQAPLLVPDPLGPVNLAGGLLPGEPPEEGGEILLREPRQFGEIHDRANLAAAAWAVDR